MEIAVSRESLTKETKWSSIHSKTASSRKSLTFTKTNQQSHNFSFRSEQKQSTKLSSEQHNSDKQKQR